MSRECLEQGPTKENKIIILHFNTSGTYIPNRSWPKYVCIYTNIKASEIDSLFFGEIREFLTSFLAI